MQKYKWVPLCSDFFCFAILCSFLYYKHNCRYYIITNPCLSNELASNYWFCSNVIMIIMNGTKVLLLLNIWLHFYGDKKYFSWSYAETKCIILAGSQTAMLLIMLLLCMKHNFKCLFWIFVFKNVSLYMEMIFKRANNSISFYRRVSLKSAGWWHDVATTGQTQF